MQKEIPVYLSSDDEIAIRKKKTTFNFSMIGRMKMLKTPQERFDIFDIIKTMSKPELKFFIEVKEKTNYQTGLSQLNKPTTKSEEQARSRAYNKLKQKKLIRRVRPLTYIINPKYFVPPSRFVDGIIDTWNKCK
jgi:benzoyl-CoA reductase/2-hydroxyglutaryl-CoA dehydratase subunit BcrC/BadD/HgdB